MNLNELVKVDYEAALAQAFRFTTDKVPEGLTDVEACLLCNETSFIIKLGAIYKAFSNRQMYKRLGRFSQNRLGDDLKTYKAKLDRVSLIKDKIALSA